MAALQLTHVWRWATIADPWRPKERMDDAPPPRRIVSPLAPRCGQLCRVLAQGSNGNRLIEFADGYRVVAPFYAVRRAV